MTTLNVDVEGGLVTNPTLYNVIQLGKQLYLGVDRIIVTMITRIFEQSFYKGIIGKPVFLCVLDNLEHLGTIVTFYHFFGRGSLLRKCEIKILVSTFIITGVVIKQGQGDGTVNIFEFFHR